MTISTVTPNSEARTQQADLSRSGLEWITWLGLAAIAAIAAGLYFWAYLHHPWRPRSPDDLGWFGWFDQSWYYKAALAWVAGNLDPGQHFYLPGYPLMGALFVPLMPLQPFLIPNLICMLLALWIFSELIGALFPEFPVAKLTGAAVFFACSVLNSSMFEQWVVPISTTASAPIVYSCLLAAVRFIEAPQRLGLAFLAALACGGIALFRPTDTLPVLVATAGGMGIALLQARLGWQRLVRTALTAAIGAVIPLSLLAVLYLAIYGFRQSDYVAVNSMLGFEWRLMPLRWVDIFIDPRPLMPEGEGLIHRFPWIIPGLAGLAAVFAQPLRRSHMLAHGVVVGAVVLHTLLYCAYRELHPGGLFRFGNYHYFKWILPVFGIYALRFIWALLFGPRRLSSAAIGAILLLLLLPWRIELRAVPPAEGPAPVVRGRSLMFSADLSNVYNTLLVPAIGSWGDIYGGGHDLSIAGKDWGYTDFRLFAQPNGFMVAAHRPLGKGIGILTPVPSVTIRSDAPPIYARQEFAFGLPCLVLSDRAVCQPTELIPPPDFQLGTELHFDGSEKPYLATGWSFIQDNGRWTDGKRVAIRLRVADLRVDTPLVLKLEASAFAPPGAKPLNVQMQVNGRHVGTWTLNDSSLVPLEATIAPNLIGSDKLFSLILWVENPRIPRELQPDSKDARELGLFVHLFSLRAQRN